MVQNLLLLIRQSVPLSNESLNSQLRCMKLWQPLPAEQRLLSLHSAGLAPETLCSNIVERSPFLFHFHKSKYDRGRKLRIAQLLDQDITFENIQVFEHTYSSSLGVSLSLSLAPPL